MKKGVNTLVDKVVSLHQPFIRMLAKRERTDRLTFSFHQHYIFDEYLMNTYIAINQYVYSSFHHFIKLN